ncbi:hypothetical protein D3C83_281280 [compost metagenome]
MGLPRNTRMVGINDSASDTESTNRTHPVALQWSPRPAAPEGSIYRDCRSLREPKAATLHALFQ